MLTLGMCRINHSGFTLVEILVVLVLMSLSLTLILPSFLQDPVSNSERIEGFRVALLAHADVVRDHQKSALFSRENAAEFANLLQVPVASIQISDPILIGPSGACLDGAFRYVGDGLNIDFEITSPLCTLGIRNGE